MRRNLEMNPSLQLHLTQTWLYYLKFQRIIPEGYRYTISFEQIGTVARGLGHYDLRLGKRLMGFIPVFHCLHIVFGTLRVIRPC